MLDATTARKIHDQCVRYGDFELSSGQKSHWYFDKYQLLARDGLFGCVFADIHRRVLEDLCKQGRAPQAIAGAELGGALLAQAVVAAGNYEGAIDALYVRKAAKAYGTEQQLEGVVRPEGAEPRDVLLLEDVVTTGGQVNDAARAIEAQGDRVVTIYAMMNRRDDRERGMLGEWPFTWFMTPEDLGIEEVT